MLLEDGNTNMRVLAVNGLKTWGTSENIPALKKALKDPSRAYAIGPTSDRGNQFRGEGYGQGLVPGQIHETWIDGTGEMKLIRGWVICSWQPDKKELPTPRLVGGSILFKSGVKSDPARLEVEPVDELASFSGAPFPLHSAVFPLDRQGAAVTNVVQRANDGLEIHAAPSQRAEIPAATRIAEVQMTREYPVKAVERDQSILHVNVEDPIGKPANELGRIDSLPNQMAGIEVETKLRDGYPSSESPFGGVDVEGDFRRMHFQRELHFASANTSRIG